MKNHPTTQQPAAGQAAHTPTPWQFTFISGQHNAAFLHTESIAKFSVIARDLSGDNAAFIVRACNSHAALVAALDNAERTIRALASSELSIDYDRNRTPLRLAQRADVYAAADQARAALALAKEASA